MAGKMSEYAVGPGNVHFKKEGSKLLADHVAAVIKVALKRNAEKSEKLTFYGIGRPIGTSKDGNMATRP